jgi:HK97 family phage portal protein
MWSMPRSGFDYGREVGDGTGSSTVMAPLNWIARTFPAAPVALWKILEDGQEDQEIGHDMIRLLHRPNEHYTGKLLMQATALDYYISGNAYWLKLRNRKGKGVPAELWWVPSTMIEPKPPDDGDNTVFIDYYDYRPNGVQVRLSPDDVVHFRFGLDKENQRLGMSPIASVLREIFTDDEAANYTAALLKNMGVPGILISPKEGGSGGPGEEDVKATKEYMRTQFTGDKRGEPLVMSGPTEVEQFGFNPEQMQLKDLRRVPEERVTAVLGIPAIVAGLGAGLDRSTFANFAEARKAAYESNTIPAQEVMAEDVRFQLLPDFEEDPMKYKVAFDLSNVRILQEDEHKRAERLDIGVKGGWIKRGEARREMGFEATPADDVYLVPIALVETRLTEDGTEVEAKESNLPDAPVEEGDPEVPGIEAGSITYEEQKARVKVKGLKARRAAKLEKNQQPYQQVVIKLLDRDASVLHKALMGELEREFTALGTKAATVFSETIKPEDLETKGRDSVGIKIADSLAAHEVVLNLKINEWMEDTLTKRLGASAARTILQTLSTVKDSLNLEIAVPDSATAKVVKEGGRRAGLIDIEKQTKQAIMRAIAKGREDKLDPNAIAQLIAEEVPKGRFVKAGAVYRAELISLTEVKYAQSKAAIAVYEASQHIKECIAFDGTGDEECAARNGETYSFADAEAEAEEEHPNGNLAFAPVVG